MLCVCVLTVEDSEDSENSDDETQVVADFSSRNRATSSPLTPSNQANQALVNLIAEKKSLSKCDAELLVAEGYKLREAKVVLTPQKVDPDESVTVEEGKGSSRMRFSKKPAESVKNRHKMDDVSCAEVVENRTEEVSDSNLSERTKTSRVEVDRCRTRLCSRMNSNTVTELVDDGSSDSDSREGERIPLFDKLHALKNNIVSPDRTSITHPANNESEPSDPLSSDGDRDGKNYTTSGSLRDSATATPILLKVLQSSPNQHLSSKESPDSGPPSDQLSSCSSDSEIVFNAKSAALDAAKERPVTRCSQSFTYESEISDCETKIKIRGIRKMKFYGDKGSTSVVTSSRTGKYVKNNKGSGDATESSSVEKLAAKRKLTKYDAQLIKEARKVPKLKIRIGDEIVTSSEDEVSPRSTKRTKSELCSNDNEPLISDSPRPVTRGKKIPTPGAKPPPGSPKLLLSKELRAKIHATDVDECGQKRSSVVHNFVPRMSQLKQLYEIPPHPMCQQMKAKPVSPPPTPPDSLNGTLPDSPPTPDEARNVFGGSVASLSFNGLANAALKRPPLKREDSDSGTRKVRFIFGHNNTLDLQVPKNGRQNRMKRTKPLF